MLGAAPYTRGVPEERKLVTVLFADIVDSTALAAGAQPEVVRRHPVPRVRAIPRDPERHGGTVEKFIDDEVMAVFGAPATHEDDAARAVRAAFALQEARGQLTLRIGLNTGEVVAASGASDQFLVSGEPVIVAARLRAAAKPGEILVGPATKTLTTPGVRYGRRRAVQAKGLGKIEAWPAEGLDLALPDPVWDGIFLAEVRLELGRFLLAQGRHTEACAELERARDFYADPLAFRKREPIEALLRTCDEVPAT